MGIRMVCQSQNVAGCNIILVRANQTLGSWVRIPVGTLMYIRPLLSCPVREDSVMVIKVAAINEVQTCDECASRQSETYGGRSKEVNKLLNG